ncbi:MAG: hypothetical protein EOP85_04445 [Verrucomicrobiaceae bacterium]|nr:MAG: hypothetical protein EOP85_04445 [Verrucomicrobiaceae bacterium]
MKPSFPFTQLITVGFLSAIFGCSSKPSATPDSDTRISVTAELNHKIGPIDRGDRYEDPLEEALAGKGFGETDGVEIIRRLQVGPFTQFV